MRRAFLMVFLAAAVTVGLTGCCTQSGQCLTGSCASCPENCSTCDSGCETGMDTGGGYACDPYGGRGGGMLRGRCRDGFAPGPPSAAITYPYYTVRGPRDFLAANPSSIGP